jgi:hypothetical protein
MEVLVAGVILLGVVLFAGGQSGWAACAFMVAAFMWWWDGQPGPTLDQGIEVRADDRPKAKYPKSK